MGTLTHRAKILCTGPELFNEELHLREALAKCKYPRWGIQKVQSKFINSNWEDDSINNNNQEGNPAQGTHSLSGSTEERAPRGKPSVGHIVIPYIQGLGKIFQEDLWKIWNSNTLQEEQDLKTITS